MEYYAIGDIVRDARWRHGLTQEELAFGICSVSTLSKIETGSRKPHCSTFEALMERMGEPLSMHVHYIEKRELERRRLIKSLEHEMRIKGGIRIREILEKYNSVPGKENLLDAQWRRLAEAIIHLQDKISASEVYKELAGVIHMTRPDFNGKWVSGKILYTHCEAMIFQMMALCLQRQKRYKEAENILQELLLYYQRIFEDGDWMEEAEVSVYHQLAELYFEMGRYSSSAGFCAKGIQKSLSQEHCHFVPALLAQWACVMTELGDTSESHKAAYHAKLLNEIWTNQKYLSKFLQIEYWKNS